MSQLESTFTNNSNLPIVLESWHSIYSGLSTMKEITVYPHQTVKIVFNQNTPSTENIEGELSVSSTGEWYIHNLLYNKANFKLWTDNGHTSYGRIGKFWLTYVFKHKECGTFSEYDWADITLTDDLKYVFSINNKN